MKKNIVALIPLRGGSKSIPNKNLKDMDGKPLCAWVIEAACRAIGPSNVFVSTESKEIAGVVENLKFNILITLQATSPLTTSDDIRKALGLFKKNKFDSLLTGVRSKRFFWTIEGKAINYTPMDRPFRQQMDGWVMENG